MKIKLIGGPHDGRIINNITPETVVLALPDPQSDDSDDASVIYRRHGGSGSGVFVIDILNRGSPPIDSAR